MSLRELILRSALNASKLPRNLRPGINNMAEMGDTDERDAIFLLAAE
jgi:hypothetical protein